MSLDLGTLTGYLDLDDSKFESMLGKLPGKLELSGTAMKLAAGGLALGVGLAIGGGIANAIDLDDANRQITAQLGLSADESARIGGVAGKLYADAYGQSVEEVNGAVQNVVSSIEGMRDASSDAIEDMTAKALNFGTAFEVDTARSTQVVGQLIKGGLVADANEGFDLLTAAMQRVPAGVREDILDAADEYGPFFQQMGIDGEAAMNLLVASSEKGMYGIDKTGDAVKEFSIRATDMSKATAGAYEALGMSQEDMTRRLLAGGDEAAGAFSEIVTGLRGIQDPAAQSQAALALFGTPLEDLGTSEIPSFLAGLQETTGQLGEVAGAADAMGETLNGSASVGWTQLQRTWDGIVGQVGGALLPILQEVIGFLNENPAILGAVATALGVVAAALGVAAIAQWAMNTALFASPMTWIILGIMALIAALIWLVANWDSVAAWISEIWGGFMIWIQGVMDGFVAWWNELWGGFGIWISEVWNGFVAWIQAVWQGFVDWITGSVQSYVNLFVGAWEAIVTNVTNAWNGLVAVIRTAWSAVVSWVTGAVNGFVSWWGGVWQGAADLVTGAWDWIVSGIQARWESVMSLLTGIPGAIQAVFAGAGEWLVNAGRWILDGLLNGLRAAWEGVTNFIGGIGTWIAENKGPESYDRNLLVRHGGWIMSGLSGGLADGFGDVQDQVAAMAGEIEASFGSPDLSASMTALGATDPYKAASEAHSAAQGANLTEAELARWQDIIDRLDDVAAAVRSARPITVQSYDKSEAVMAVAEELR